MKTNPKLENGLCLSACEHCIPECGLQADLKVMLGVFTAGRLGAGTVLAVRWTTWLQGEGILLFSCLCLEGQPQATCDSVAEPPSVNLTSQEELSSPDVLCAPACCGSGRVCAHGWLCLCQSGANTGGMTGFSGQCLCVECLHTAWRMSGLQFNT